jgi:hypothetical protein
MLTVAAAIAIAAWSLVGDFRREPGRGVPAQEAREICPRDAVPLEAGAVRRSVALVRADARQGLRSSAQLEVQRAARAATSGQTLECGHTFRQRAVVVWLTSPREQATWEFVVYRAPHGYRIWRAAAVLSRR